MMDDPLNGYSSNQSGQILFKYGFDPDDKQVKSGFLDTIAFMPHRKQLTEKDLSRLRDVTRICSLEEASELLNQLVTSYSKISCSLISGIESSEDNWKLHCVGPNEYEFYWLKEQIAPENLKSLSQC